MISSVPPLRLSDGQIRRQWLFADQMHTCTTQREDIGTQENWPCASRVVRWRLSDG